jgi:glycine dehydrogenase subunit 1
VGETKDLNGKRAFVMTLRTREQDIRREKATSNICSNVALQALAATLYLSLMGKNGLRKVASLCLQKSHYAASEIASIPGFSMAYPNAKFFNEFAINTPTQPEKINAALWENGIIGGYPLSENQLLISVTEMRTKDEIDSLASILRKVSH